MMLYKAKATHSYQIVRYNPMADFKQVALQQTAMRGLKDTITKD